LKDGKRRLRLLALCLLTGCHPHPGQFIGVAAQPQVAPASLSFDGIGSANAQSVTVSQAQYGGAFVASSTTCSDIATISSYSGRTFGITPVGAGTCSFVFTGEGGASATLDIGVTTTAVSGS
jgi:hypothetical protein